MDTDQKGYIYARVSTLKQAEYGQGVETQLALCRKFSKQKGIKVQEEYVDRGVSGATLDRPALEEMLGDLNGVDVVVVANTSRLWRAIYPQALIQKTLKDAGKDVVSVDQPGYSIYGDEDDEHAEQALVNGIMEVIDRYQRLEIKRKLKRGRKQKAISGQKACGPAPLGYEWVERKAGGKRERVIEPVSEEAVLVKDVFNSYVRLGSITRVQKFLNRRGNRTRNGKSFSHQSIHNVLTNPVYIGVVRHGQIKSNGQHQPIISRVVFGKAKAALKRNRR